MRYYERSDTNDTSGSRVAPGSDEPRHGGSWQLKLAVLSFEAVHVIKPLPCAAASSSTKRLESEFHINVLRGRGGLSWPHVAGFAIEDGM